MAGGDQSWAGTWDILRDVVHPFSLYLDTYEQAVLQFIFYRTRLYRKEWETISLNHFKFGIATQDGRFVAAPLDMGEPRLLESLKHLEGKHIIEVRRYPGTNRGNQYRIRGEDELDRMHVASYMRQHQRKTNERMLAKFAQNKGIQALLMGIPTPQSLGTPPNNHGVPPPNDYGVQNTPIVKEPISNSALSARQVKVPVKLRTINIRK